MIEVTLTLAIMSLIAVLALPRSSVNGTSTSLRIQAFEITALLRADRNAALRSGRTVTTFVDLAARLVRSGASNGAVPISEHYALRVSDAVLPGIRFEPDGTASGGEIYLARGDGKGILAIRINDLTSAIAIDRGGPHGG